MQHVYKHTKESMQVSRDACQAMIACALAGLAAACCMQAMLAAIAPQLLLHAASSALMAVPAQPRRCSTSTPAAAAAAAAAGSHLLWCYAQVGHAPARVAVAAAPQVQPCSTGGSLHQRARHPVTLRGQHLQQTDIQASAVAAQMVAMPRPKVPCSTAAIWLCQREH